jgi:GNAT superfamily N-acetyltransferase
MSRGRAIKPLGPPIEQCHHRVMTVSVCPLEEGDIGPVVEFSVRAWKPVFESMCRVMGSEIFKRVYPDWAAGQAQAVESVCRAEGNRVWVATEDGRPVGLVAVVLHDQDGPKSGEIEMVAVDPECQSRGIGLDRRRSRSRSSKAPL